MKNVKLASVVKLKNQKTKEDETHIRSSVILEFEDSATEDQMISEARNMTIFRRKKLGWDPFAGSEVVVLEQTEAKSDTSAEKQSSKKANNPAPKKPKTEKKPKEKTAKPAKVSAKKSVSKSGEKSV